MLHVSAESPEKLSAAPFCGRWRYGSNPAASELLGSVRSRANLPKVDIVVRLRYDPLQTYSRRASSVDGDRQMRLARRAERPREGSDHGGMAQQVRALLPRS